MGKAQVRRRNALIAGEIELRAEGEWLLVCARQDPSRGEAGVKDDRLHLHHGEKRIPRIAGKGPTPLVADPVLCQIDPDAARIGLADQGGSWVFKLTATRDDMYVVVWAFLPKRFTIEGLRVEKM